jgi:hypothetical protein
VPLVKAESTDSASLGKPVVCPLLTSLFAPSDHDHPSLCQRKPPTCSRCHSIMYPFPNGSPENHKRGYCSDGVKQVMKLDVVPDWPQPQGVFEFGTTFNPLPFLAAVREIYEKVVVNRGEENLTMENEAFARLLEKRTIVANDGRCLFKLFDLETPLSTAPELIVELNGLRYLRVDCLRDDGISSQAV